MITPPPRGRRPSPLRIVAFVALLITLLVCSGLVIAAVT